MVFKTCLLLSVVPPKTQIELPTSVAVCERSGFEGSRPCTGARHQYMLVEGACATAAEGNSGSTRVRREADAPSGLGVVAGSRVLAEGGSRVGRRVDVSAEPASVADEASRRGRPGIRDDVEAPRSVVDGCVSS